MSRFHIGQSVYVSYTANRIGDGRLLCSVGTLLDGPFPKSKLAEGEEMSGPWWDVEIDGHECACAESILSPFNPPNREVDIEQCLELTE